MSGEKRREPAQDEDIDETVEESFPASDPPSNTPVSGTGRKDRAQPKPDEAPSR